MIPFIGSFSAGIPEEAVETVLVCDTTFKQFIFNDTGMKLQLYTPSHTPMFRLKGRSRKSTR